MASSYAEAVIAVEFDAITFLSREFAASYKYRIDSLLILNFLGLTNTHFERIRDMVTTGSGFVVEQLDGHTHYTLTPDFGVDILCPEVGDTLGISTGHMQCFWRRAIVANEVQPVARESIYYYRKNGTDDRDNAKSWIAENILGGTSTWSVQKASKYFDKTCERNNAAQSESRSYGCLYIDPGYRWVSRLHEHSSKMSPFSISDKTIIVAIMTIVSDTGDVIRRRLLTVDNNQVQTGIDDMEIIKNKKHPVSQTTGSNVNPNSRHLLHETAPETVSQTVGNSAVQINNAGVNAAANIAYLCGLEDNLWQLLHIETAHRAGIPLQTFAVNARNVMLSMQGSMFGQFVRSIHPIGFETIRNTATINITVILEMNHAFGNVSTKILECVILDITDEKSLLHGEQVGHVVETCVGIAANQTRHHDTVMMRLSACGGYHVSIQPSECNSLPDFLAIDTQGKTGSFTGTYIILILAISLYVFCICGPGLRAFSVMVSYTYLRIFQGMSVSRTAVLQLPIEPTASKQSCSPPDTGTASLLHTISKAKLGTSHRVAVNSRDMEQLAPLLVWPGFVDS
jgi:hypothetical protein